jgi:Domain of unknown function (DUF4397)
MRGKASILIGAMVALVVLVPPTLAAPRQASVVILHGLPGFTADIYLDDELLLDGFEPTAVAGPLRVDPGTYHVDIREVGADADSEPALSADLKVAPGANISAIAHLSGAGEPMLSAFVNSFPRLSPGRSFLQIRHLADAPALGIRFDDRRLAGVLRPGADRLIDARPGRHALGLVSSSASEPLLPEEDVRLDEGAAAIVYLIGSQDGGLELMVQSLPDLGSAPSGILTGYGDAGDARRARPLVLAIIVAAAATLFVSGQRLIRRRSIDP